MSLPFEEAARDAGIPLLATFDARIESLLVAAPGPMTLEQIQALLPEGAEVLQALGRIAEFWEGRGASLTFGPDGYLLRARRELVPKVPSAPGRRLSEGAVATLAVIAMHQPISVSQIETVRRVKLTRGIMEALEHAGLIEEVDRRKGTGRARLYGTTEEFLRMTGLDALADMPTPEEVIHADLVEA